MNTPVYLRIAAELKKKILMGELLDGFMLPSERKMAEIYNVHRNTVTKAYNELKAEELVKAVHGVGYRVTYGDASREESVHPGGVNWEDAIKDEYLDMEHSFDELFIGSFRKGTFSFAGGISSPTVYGEEDIGKLFHGIIAKQRGVKDYYTPYQGDENLRRHISYFLKEKGMSAGYGQIQIFSEINQALDFIVTLLLTPGDKVITEEPVSPDVYRAIQLAGGEIITIPMDEEGMICDRLGPLLEKHHPKFIYVNGSFHDPTGVELSLKRKKNLLELADHYRIPIIEDDSSSELYYGENRVPSLKALDKGENVIYMYSFAMTFAPGGGMAFVYAPKKIIESLSYLVSVRLISLDWVSQKLLQVAMESRLYQDKLADFRREYKTKRDGMYRWLRQLAPRGVLCEEPPGGVYLWCRLPDAIDGEKLMSMAGKKGVSFVPGHVFYPKGNGGERYIRLNFSYPSPEEIDQGMEILTENILAQLK